MRNSLDLLELNKINLSHCKNKISGDEIIRLDFQDQFDHVQRLVDQGFDQSRIDEAKRQIGMITRKIEWVKRHGQCEFYRYSHWPSRSGSSGFAAVLNDVVVDTFVEYFS